MKGKDFNLFEVYRNGPSKPADSGWKQIVAVALVFLAVIAIAYSGINFMINGYKDKINKINAELNEKQVLEANEKLSIQIKKNQLLADYSAALTLAQKNFDSSRIIDGTLIHKLLDATPENTALRSMTINPMSLEMTFISADSMAPAYFTQSLNKYDIFKSITYDGVTLTEDKEAKLAGYLYTLKCQFKEAAAQ